MSEKFLIIDHLKVSYEGLFNAAELYNVIASFFFGKHWDWHEKVNMERVTADGRQIYQNFYPWKSVSNYYKIIMGIKIIMADVKEVEVAHEGDTLRLNQGTVRITIDGYVVADRDHEWTGSVMPFRWFFTILGQKYFFRDHFKKMETWLRGDVEDLHGRIKRHLNTFKYTYQS